MQPILTGFDTKGVPLGTEISADHVATAGWNVAAGDTATPIATLSGTALEKNAAAMRAWCDRHGVSIAPHAKTTLSPELVRFQLDNGAWGLTAALPRQVALLWEFGATRVILANEVVDATSVRWLAAELAEHPDRALAVYADSLEGVSALSAALDSAPLGHSLDVLIELGYPGGRTGARSVAEATAVAAAVVESPRLRLSGVAAYEGTIGTNRKPEVLDRIDALLRELGDLAEQLGDKFEVDEPIVTAGGSIFFDRVAAILAERCAVLGFRVVLRSGCYLIHDHGLYESSTPLSAGVDDAPQFLPALSVWGRVVSTPEPGLALVDAGRRDLSFDAGMPVPIERWRGTKRVDLGSAPVTVAALSDQHTFVSHDGTVDLRVGDLVRLGISHPCTTLDRWRAIFVIDDDHRVTGVISTSF